MPFIIEIKSLPIIQFQTNKQILPAHDRNAATIPILLARNRASLSSLPVKQKCHNAGNNYKTNSTTVLLLKGS